MIKKEPVQSAGLYIHIPFCLKKCLYCDFYSITDISLVAEFVSALPAEISMREDQALPCDTIYFGGGTPSILQYGHIHQILDKIHQCFPINRKSEITIEVNPGTVTEQTLAAYRNAGINRISIGVQSFRDGNLFFLGRIHDASQAENTISAARKAGFDNIGIDLIYGLPGQSRDAWKSDLMHALKFEPEHLSCYMLTYETGTCMTRKVKKGDIHPLPEKQSAALFDFTIAFLKDHGYLHYEVSNFASSENRMSRHNQKYWTLCPYLGFGPSAHSFIPFQRTWNHRSVKQYLEDIHAGRPPIADTECLKREQQMIESIYLGLRQCRGIDMSGFDLQYKVCFKKMFNASITLLQKDRYLDISKGRCFLTAKGMRYLDSITAMFVQQITVYGSGNG